MKRVARLAAVSAVVIIGASAVAIISASAVAQESASNLNVVVLVDVTASLHRCPEGVAGLVSSTASNSPMVGRARNDRRPIPPAVGLFVLNGHRSGDRIRVGALSRRTYLSGPHLGDSDELKRSWGSVFGLPPVEWLGPSPIWDALGDIVEMLSVEPGSRSVIVVSDGQANGNRRSPQEVVEAAKRSNVRISAVGEESIISTYPSKTMAEVIGKDPTTNLKLVAEATGGRFFFDKANIIPGACYQLNPGKWVTEAFADLRARSGK